MKLIALIVAILTGWVISQYLLAGASGAYVSVLFAYHFFLVFLIAYMDWSGGLKLPVQQAVIVHSAILIVLLGFIAVRSYIPAFGLVSSFVPAIAFLEVEWIFGKQKKQQESATAPALPYKASQDDYSEFLHYLKRPVRRFAKPGRPVQEEYSLWLEERNKVQAASQSQGNSAPGSSQNPQAR